MWRGFEPEDDFFLGVLSDRFVVELTEDPDLLVHSCYGRAADGFRCLKLYVSFENRGWGFGRTDIAITSDYVRHPDHYRYPLWAVHLAKWPHRYQVDVPRVHTNSRGFAATVVSNAHGATRNRIFDLLDAQQDVASGGRYQNNVGSPVDDKVEFMSNYRFGLAFENSSYPGYATEKLLDAFQAGTVPIYWGDPLITRDFNGRAFVNCHDFSSEAELVQHIIEIDSDRGRLQEMLAEPWFHKGTVPEFARRSNLAEWLSSRIDFQRVPVSQRRRSPQLLTRQVVDRWQTSRRYRRRIM